MQEPDAKWLRLSEETNALDYLRRAAAYIREAENDPVAWKWTVISLHGAMYGFAVAAARGTNFDNVLTKNGKLLGFWPVLKLCQDEGHMRMLVHSKPLELSAREQESIEQLTSMLRNEFMHFKPKSWSIELHGMPTISIDALRVIGFLALDTGTYVHLTDQQRGEARKLVTDTTDYLRSTTLFEEAQIGRKLWDEQNNPD